ncbi:Putative arsenical resistance operon repressor ArsR [uncultured archaeon]|nr:Putative arsenical resistance operon repressor ArsR [uncultured archaeon]
MEKERKHSLKEKINSDKLINDIAGELKILSDESRIRILILLNTIKELNVNEIASFVDISPSAVSHQLKVLKDIGVVDFRREGKELYYSLSQDNNAESVEFLLNKFESYKEHLNDHSDVSF